MFRFTFRNAFFLFGVSVSCAFFAERADAILLYGTDLNNGHIVTIDTATNAVRNIANVPGPDSLLFDSQGRIIYSAYTTGQIRRYDLTAHTDTLLASGFSRPVDIALEPGLNSLLITEQSGNKIDRLDLTTNAVSLLRRTPGSANGIVYDNTGRLFASISSNTLAQIDPITGATLQSFSGLSVDGLTFDAKTGKLYGAVQGAGKIYSFNPNSLASGGTTVVNVPGPDGVVTDSDGNLYIAARGDFHVYTYNPFTGSLVRGASVPGLDDLAPASGLGAPVPEPGSLALLMGSAVCGTGLLLRRRRK